MCGIAGIILKPNSSYIDLEPKLRAMAQAMAHRGPDDEGFFVSPNGCVGLVNRRLAIRDLSPAGHMPMANDTQDVVITYNGEIYNADELRVQLEDYGYAFRSNSDTEVILRGYEQWGEEIVAKLRGMFAFAVCDFREGRDSSRIMIARDHMGIKPIYYYQSTNAIVFASELKALLASRIMTREVDPAGLVGYLLTGSVPNPLSIYRGISSLEPSSYLLIDASERLSLEAKCYWSLPTDISQVNSIDDAIGICRERLTEAVRIRLVSDVPLGAFLSGGLDSSAVVALMRQATSGPIRTCSMVFEEASYSESRFARAMAESVGSEHFERVITFEDVAKEFDNILYAIDQPSVDGVNTYFASQTARQAGLTVALSGLGGDELFGGYPNTFRGIPRFYNKLLQIRRVPAGTTLARIANSIRLVDARRGHNADALRRPPSLANAYARLRNLFSTLDVKHLVVNEMWEEALNRFDVVQSISSRAATNEQSEIDEFSWVSRALLRNFMHDQLLRDTDVMSMTHSLEVRVPFVDYQLVSAILRLPESIKRIDDQLPKPLLNRAMQGLVPDALLSRRDKQGFVFPFAVWLRGGLANKAMQAIECAVGNRLIRSDGAKRVVDGFERGTMNWSHLWSLAVLASVASE